ncbi:hypothetical protein DYB37_008225 [Aphanomyces astaci]|uniref:Uncharacterized protein n=1 Tax=Aphanomyces astaci TaxID=112090 RepID=A0A418D3N6_APHAT|nr:hypothetical protein DYB35_007835 [Aphanomyces astaci]RHZ22582.1 hypothetical protein DYB37_008225 [Aphanomyces astaci]
MKGSTWATSEKKMVSTKPLSTGLASMETKPNGCPYACYAKTWVQQHEDQVEVKKMPVELKKTLGHSL